MLKPYLSAGISTDIFKHPAWLEFCGDYDDLSYAFHFGRRLSPREFESWKQNANYCFTFKMWSFGPDQCDQYGRLHYNISNGIISRGDIIDGLGRPSLGIDYSLPPEKDWKPWVTTDPW